MTKNIKKKPKTVERWGIYDDEGNFLLVTSTRDTARSYCIGGRSMYRVKIIVQTPKKKTVLPDRSFSGGVIEQDSHVQP